MDGMSAIGGNMSMDQFQAQQASLISSAQTQATQQTQGAASSPQSSGPSTAQDAAQSVGNAQGAQTSEYPPL